MEHLAILKAALDFLMDRIITAGQPPQGKMRQFNKAAKEGLRLTGTALRNIISRSLWWGGIGALAGFLLAVICWLCGWLVSPWPVGSTAVIVGALVLYPLAGILCLGFAGFWRGVGRFVLHLAIEEKWLRMMLEKIICKLAENISDSESMSAKMEKTQAWLENLPLEKWEQLIKSVVRKVMLVDRPQDAGLIIGVVYRYLGRKIESYLLKSVRKEADESGGGSICLQRLREVSLDTAEDFFVDTHRRNDEQLSGADVCSAAADCGHCSDRLPFIVHLIFL